MSRTTGRIGIAFGIVFLACSFSSLASDKLTARDLFLSSQRANQPQEQNVSAKADKPLSIVPLGLRYSILKQAGNNQVVEVDSESVFRSGDKIRLSVESNDRGFLYIVMRGSSGKWSLLFPSKQILDGNNVVEKGQSYEIPLASAWFRFDDRPGVEKLFLVLSRKPEPDFEKLVQSLRAGQDSSSSDKKSQDSSSIQVVTAVDDATVNKIRGTVASRDLVFEKVEEESGSRPEKAVYVVNKTGNSDARVVVDISLNHQ